MIEIVRLRKKREGTYSMISLDDLLWGDVKLPEGNDEGEAEVNLLPPIETISICCGGAIAFPPTNGAGSTFMGRCK